ncbi:MAG: energy-coupling factor transporter transmembrane protein EcfT [Clostridiaceae bacterium]|jgi:energy-coupling factor transport system permease protein|nr:energy-coupling factor transporter transmembrane protein EcfT [Tissierellia bacterium]NMB97896.1 energy-coupling factor transporter transmembrane protein EcfT [Clostridiaceae bacterium]
MKDAFSTYHPLVNFLYFAFVFAFSMVFMHPVCLVISLTCGVIYSISLKGKKAVKFNFAFLLPVMLVTALINPAFNHEGATILTYLPTGNPLTLESITYGIAASAMLSAVVCWFSCYNEIMTSDKFVYLFGRIIPAMSLILSMSLRFVPKFKAQIKVVSNAQKCIGRDVSNGGIFERARHGITILSIMVTWALENAIETADSMRSRGYGLLGRTAFSIYRFDKRDKKALLAIAFLGCYVLLGGILGGLKWRYFPTMKGAASGIFTISLWISYMGLCLVPVIVNRQEERQWNATQLKI